MRILALSVLAGSLLSSSALLAQEEPEEARPVLKHPLTPRDIEMRDAVLRLGANKHRFVRIKLRDGSTLVGGITFVGQESFSVTQGISGGKLVPYRSLELVPQPDAAIGEHFANSLKWTGVVAVCVIATPVVILMMPLVFTGVLAD